ncbi:MAG: RNA polymerase sigma factor [Actinobacteria bacterium]|nr:RNA polymerase sigma factor [Actinomycetota bacterium]
MSQSAWQPAPGLPGDDRTLVVRVAGGDRASLHVLYQRHAGWLTTRLQRRCPERELVDTALQDTFLAVWTSASKFRGDGDVGAWLWGIAVRRLIDQLRKRRPAPMDPSTAALQAEGMLPSAEAEMFAQSRTGSGDLGDAFRYLDPELQTVLLATAVDGLTTKEAAHLLGIPHGTVKTRLMRARAQLQERLA